MADRATQAPATVAEREVEAAGLRTVLQEAGAGPPVLFFHGVPTSSRDWIPFMEQVGCFAHALAPDLPGLGRSAKPRDYDYSIPGMAAWAEGLVETLGLSDKLTLVAHDWGSGPALGYAARHPDRIERLVLINIVPFSGEYRWHWVARAWRRALLGELLMVTANRPVSRLLMRQANGRPLPAAMVDDIWSNFDRATKSAILRLYRASPPAELERQSAGLEQLSAQGLIVWGDADSYLPPGLAEQMAEKLRQSHVLVEHRPDAGHWPWVGRPELVERVVTFLRDHR